MGRSFPLRRLAETPSQFEASEWDMLSPRGLLRKAHPSLTLQNGMRFPVEGHPEIASQFDASERDAVSG